MCVKNSDTNWTDLNCERHVWNAGFPYSPLKANGGRFKFGNGGKVLPEILR